MRVADATGAAHRAPGIHRGHAALRLIVAVFSAYTTLFSEIGRSPTIYASWVRLPRPSSRLFGTTPEEPPARIVVTAQSTETVNYECGNEPE